MLRGKLFNSLLEEDSGKLQMPLDLLRLADVIGVKLLLCELNVLVLVKPLQVVAILFRIANRMHRTKRSWARNGSTTERRM